MNKEILDMEHKASFRTDEVKHRVKWLLRIMAREEHDLDYDEYLADGFDDENTAEDFLMDLIAAGGVNKNILIALMDKKGFFSPIDDGIAEEEADAHDEWWYGGQAQKEGFW